MIEQSDWQDVIDQSGYTLTAVLREFNLNYSSLSNWLKCKVTPTDKNKAKMEAVLSKLVSGGGRIPFHPAYGYATEAQIKELQSIGLGPTRDLLMKKIAKQNETRGKTVF